MAAFGDVTSLGGFFAPRGIAVLGASDGEKRPGGRVLALLKATGYGGRIHPVHPGHAQLHGFPCHPSIDAVPDPVDLAILAMRAVQVPTSLRDCAARGISTAIVFADGFADPALRRELEAALADARRLSGMRMLGPNTLGLRSLPTATFATFASDIELGLTPGSVAMIAQSGGMGVYFGSAQLRRRGIGTSHIVDTGNELDVDATECLEYLAGQPSVRCLGVMIEGCRDGRRLARGIGQAVAGGKPVVFLKCGRSAGGLRQAASHTGALSGKADLFDAELQRAGAIVCRDEIDFLDALVIAASGKIPAGRKLGLVSPSGGYGVLTLDAAERYGMDVPAPVRPPDEAERQQLPLGTFGNPLDYSSTISAGPRALETALGWMAVQSNIDALLLYQGYSSLQPDRQARLSALLTELVPTLRKPLFVCGLTTPDLAESLRQLGVLCFEEPTRLVRALSVATQEVGRSKPATPRPAALRRIIAGEAARQALSGLPNLHLVETHRVESAEAATRRQAALGRKVFLKVESEQHAHKSELGLVLGPLDAADLATAFDRIAHVRESCGDSPPPPIVMQPLEIGAELALGAYVDPAFGPAIMVASGGVFLELLGDTVFAAAPVSQTQARAMILGLRGAPLLLGARGRPVADIDAAAAALADLSGFIAAHSTTYAEIDINPLILRERGAGAVAVDTVLVPAASQG